MNRNVLLHVADIASKSVAFCSGCAASLILFMTLLITLDVLGRNFFGFPIHFSTEVSGYILVALTFVGLAYTQKQGKHIRIQLLTRHLPARVQRYLELVILTIGIIVVGWLTWATKDPVIQNYVFQRKSITSLETPMWIPWLLVPIGFLMLTIQFIAELIIVLFSSDRTQDQSASEFVDTV